MTATEAPDRVRAHRPPLRAAPWARRPVVVVAAVLLLVQAVVADEYGYHADELYFRMLGERGPAWGYVDQPPLLPLLVHGAVAALGDHLWAIRVPAILFGAAVVVLGSLTAAELGGGRRAQLMTALGLGTSMTVLEFGHWILTSSLDMVAWCAVTLCALRALLRDEGRWWLAAGAVVGVALYAKTIVLLLVLALLVGLVLVGPRHHLRQRWLPLGGVVAAVIGLPNLLYQFDHDFPQLQMAHALGAADGAANRQMFLQNLLFVLGPGLVPFCAAGLLGMLRRKDWRPTAAVGVAYLVATAATFLTAGGRPDYTGPLLITLFAVGCVRAERWTTGRPVLLSVVAAGLTVTAALQVLLAVPLVPERSMRHFQINSMTLETLGWPQYVAQVGRAYRDLPADERARAVVLTENFGEAGAVDRYGDRYGLPAVHSGHNELHAWGPPSSTADVVIAVGVAPGRLAADFGRCVVVSRLDNGLGVDNPEQGRAVSVCRQPRAPWAELWPAYRHLSAYE